MFQEALVLTELGKVDEGVSLLRARLSQQSKPVAPVSSTLPDIDLYLRISNLYTQAGRGAEGLAAAPCCDLLLQISLYRFDSADHSFFGAGTAGMLKAPKRLCVACLPASPDNRPP